MIPLKGAFPFTTMADLDQFSEAIGQLRAQMTSLLDSNRRMERSLQEQDSKIEALQEFRWKIAGMMAAAGALVEGLHFWVGK
jgi:hypothetical protein